MSDITMCKNENCPSKKWCYRFLAIPNPYFQSYGEFAPEEGEKECEMFWDIMEFDNTQLDVEGE